MSRTAKVALGAVVLLGLALLGWTALEGVMQDDVMVRAG